MNDKRHSIPIGSDHGGFKMKQYIIHQLSAEGFIFKDFGTHDESSVDYPDFIHPVAKSINDGIFEKGIVICGSGQGANMVANKYQNVRSGLCWNLEQAELTRLHNNANIIALPGRFVEFELAVEMVRKFFATRFEAGRHIIRINKIPLN
jgi:ribose 5-phosphate isomerase B